MCLLRSLLEVFSDAFTWGIYFKQVLAKHKI